MANYGSSSRMVFVFCELINNHFYIPEDSIILFIFYNTCAKWGLLKCLMHLKLGLMVVYFDESHTIQTKPMLDASLNQKYQPLFNAFQVPSLPHLYLKNYLNIEKEDMINKLVNFDSLANI